MKQLFYTLTLTVTFINAYAQLDLTTYVGQSITGEVIQNTESFMSYSASVADHPTNPLNLTRLVTGDTLYFHYTLGSIDENDGGGGSDDIDTLELALSFIT